MKTSSITKCPISMIPDFMELCFETSRTLFLLGSPGIGKTQVVHQALRNRAQANGCPLEGPMAPKVVTKVLSMCDRLDFAGQSIDHDSNTMVEVVADWVVDLSKESNPEGPMTCLYLNEFNACVESMKAVLYRLIEERALGEYHLRDNVQIVCDGNPPAPGIPTAHLTWAEKRRVKTVEVVADREEWIEWAMANGVHHEVIGFLSQPTHFELFETYDPSKREQHAWCNPASWHKLGKTLDLVKGKSDRLRMINAEGDIGTAAATRFVTWQNLGAEAPDYMTALKNPDSIEFSEMKADIQWFLLSQIANAAISQPFDGKTLPEVTDLALSFATWLGGQKQSEFATFLVQFIASRARAQGGEKALMSIAKSEHINKLSSYIKENKFLMDACDAVYSERAQMKNAA